MAPIEISGKFSDARRRAIRDQEFVIDALEAELMLCSPEDESRLKERVAAERKTLQDLEPEFDIQPKSNLMRSRVPHQEIS